MKIRIAACLLVVCSIVSCAPGQKTSKLRLKELSDQIENLRSKIESVNARLQESDHIYTIVKAHLKESDFKQNRFSEQLAAHRQATAAMGVAKSGAIRDTLRLRKLEIVDEQGKTLATFGTSEGASVLEMRGMMGKGRIRMVVGEGGHGGIINIYNSFDKEVVSVESNEANEGAVFVCDINGLPKNFLSTRP